VTDRLDLALLDALRVDPLRAGPAGFRLIPGAVQPLRPEREYSLAEGRHYRPSPHPAPSTRRTVQLPSAAVPPRVRAPADQLDADSPDERFSAFVTVRWSSLVRTAYLLTGDHHEAEDLVQTTLVKLYPRWRGIREDEATGYLRQALINNNRSRLRRRRVVQLLTPFLPETPAPVEADRDSDALVRALATLPERQRAVVVLRYWEDLSVEQTAYELGCSPGTVKSQASRALAKLRADPDLVNLANDLIGELE
jgi:RNA polymerase sigma-70 factor (sigma-E family)